MVISSLENKKIKDMVKLQRKKYRDLTDTYLIETEHLVEEAYKEGLVIEIFLLEGKECCYDVPCTYVSYDVMKKLTTTESSVDIVALCQKASNNSELGNRILLLDDVQDPGNLGALIRSAVAFNVDTIILSESTVDLYNPKVLRASQGMYCHINIITLEVISCIEELKRKGYTILGTNVNNGVDVSQLNKEECNKYCLIVGNEGNGVREKIQDMCDKNLYLNMTKKVESLNVAVAGSILLYELERKNG